LCPQRVSAVECNRSKTDVYSYLRKAFDVEAAKNESYAPLILAPYNEKYDLLVLYLYFISLFQVDVKMIVLFYAYVATIGFYWALT